MGILQDLLPNARVLYSSATGASEPNNLGYMYRLGAAGFDHMKEMIDTLTKWVAAKDLCSSFTMLDMLPCSIDCQSKVSSHMLKRTQAFQATTMYSVVAYWCDSSCHLQAT